MMRKTRQYHAVRSAAVCILLALATFTGLTIRERVEEQRKASHAAGLVKSLRNADTAEVPAIVDEMAGYRKWAEPLLREAYDKAAAASRHKLHASLALLEAIWKASLFIKYSRAKELQQNHVQGGPSDAKALPFGLDRCPVGIDQTLAAPG
jgi:hypothetical protein